MFDRFRRTVRGPTDAATNDAEPPRGRRPRLRSPVGCLTVGGLAVAPLVLTSSALSSPGHAPAEASPVRLVAFAAVQPPAGMAWIQGTLTDQAGHRLNNVNVEAWSPNPTDLGPIASNLSYAGDYRDPRHQSGVFRLEVPGGAAYRLTFSTINGREDGDRFRKLVYGGGRPIMARPRAVTRAAAGQVSTRSVELPQLVGRVATPPATQLTNTGNSTDQVAAAPGRVINLGTIQLARQGHVSSTTTVRLAKKRVRAGHRARAHITLRSPYVSRVTGTVRIHVGKRTRTRTVVASDAGRITVRLPRVKAGHRLVRVRFKGSATVAPSRARPVPLIVKKRKH